MKKIIGSLLICSIMLWSVGLSAYAAAEHLVIDGTEVTIPQGMGTLRDVDNRTFVPVRYVTEDILNYKLNYGSAQESATITEPKSGVSYLMLRDSNMIFVLPNTGSGKIIMMDTNVFVDDSEGRMYIPIRFLAEAIGYTVEWDETTQTVSMFSPTPAAEENNTEPTGGAQ